MQSVILFVVVDINFVDEAITLISPYRFTIFAFEQRKCRVNHIKHGKWISFCIIKSAFDCMENPRWCLFVTWLVILMRLTSENDYPTRSYRENHGVGTRFEPGKFRVNDCPGLVFFLVVQLLNNVEVAFPDVQAHEYVEVAF